MVWPTLGSRTAKEQNRTNCAAAVTALTSSEIKQQITHYTDIQKCTFKMPNML